MDHDIKQLVESFVWLMIAAAIFNFFWRYR